LSDDGDSYLVERFTISYVTSGRDLLRLRSLEKNAPDAAAAIIVANPQFQGVAGGSRATSTTASSTRGLDARALAQVLRFTPLPGTGLEATALQAVLPGARVYTGVDATEAQLKRVRGPSILHIATHGFFLRTATRPATTSRPYSIIAPQSAAAASEREEALVRSGLALAGANQRSSGAGEDGLLTALEVTGLDLWGTRMVVLSACETGVGEPKVGEGVFGLRRALVLAGSESQVISLWRVPDVATRDLMVAYYQRLRAREGRADALRQVQLAMLHGERTRVHPFYWAGFIESGDWRPAFDQSDQ
jgi:CHAT domain-containing protein